MIYGLNFFCICPFLSISKTIHLILIGNINFILFMLWFEDEGGAAAWNGKHDDRVLKAIKCRWKNCHAVLQSRAHCLKHVQVRHVGEVVVGLFVF